MHEVKAGTFTTALSKQYYMVIFFFAKISTKNKQKNSVTKWWFLVAQKQCLISILKSYVLTVEKVHNFFFLNFIC